MAGDLAPSKGLSVLAKEAALNVNVQTIFWMDAFLYLMLHAAIWYGLARFRSPVVVMWSVSGIFSALGLCVLGSRGWLSTDVVVVVGANDVVNPAARHDQSSPIYGMPILDVDKAATVMVVKRSMRPGFAGVENELFFNEKTLMVFGDAKDVMGELITEVSGNRDSINV